MKRITVLLTLLLTLPLLANAATGDILFNCTFDEPGSTATQVVENCGASTGTGLDGTIVAAGHDGGNAIEFYYPNTGEVYDPFDVLNVNKSEITIVYWERFDVDPVNSTIWNVKSIRPYIGPSSSDYMGTIMSLHNNNGLYQSYWESADLTITDKVTYVASHTGYCSGSGYDYSCPNRVETKWTPGWGTSWHKIRLYLRAPSSPTASDGKIELWIDDELMYTLTNVKGDPNYYNYYTNIRFHPSDDFLHNVSGNTFPFHHSYDDITIFEGYVPPTGPVPPVATIAPPTGLRIIN